MFSYYEKLISLGKVDFDKIYNLNNHSYEDEKKSFLGDLGVMGSKIYRFTDYGWQFMFYRN